MTDLYCVENFFLRQTVVKILWSGSLLSMIISHFRNVYDSVIISAVVIFKISVTCERTAAKKALYVCV